MNSLIIYGTNDESCHWHGGKNEANGRQKRRKHSSSSETAIKIIPIVSSHYYTAVVVVCIRVEQWFKVCLHPCYSNANENQIFMVNKCICRRLGTRPFASMTARMILWWISWNITIKEMIVFSYLIVGVCVCNGYSSASMQQQRQY